MQRRKRINPLFSFQTHKFSKRFKRRLFKYRASTMMLIIGLCLIAIGGMQSIQAYSAPIFEGDIQRYASYTIQPIQPANITIESADIKLPIIMTQINNGVWEIAENGVSYLSSSSSLGAYGNMIFYGHNTNDRLGPLHKVIVGDKIVITDQKGNNYNYIVSSIRVVDPTNIESLTSFEGETITIYTCTGFADLKRLLIKAQRIN